MAALLAEADIRFFFGAVYSDRRPLCLSSLSAAAAAASARGPHSVPQVGHRWWWRFWIDRCSSQCKLLEELANPCDAVTGSTSSRERMPQCEAWPL